MFVPKEIEPADQAGDIEPKHRSISPRGSSPAPALALRSRGRPGAIGRRTRPGARPESPARAETPRRREGGERLDTFLSKVCSQVAAGLNGPGSGGNMIGQSPNKPSKSPNAQTSPPRRDNVSTR